MAKKKTHKSQQTRRTTQPQKFSLGRYYRHNKKRIERGLLYAALGITGLVLIWVAITLLSNREITLSKQEYLDIARKEFYLGHYDAAILNYHKAQNVDPEDKLLQREYYLARTRDDMTRGISIENARAATQQLLDEFPNSLVGKVSHAQLLGLRGQTGPLREAAGMARDMAIQNSDSAALMAADFALATYYRSKELHDSAYIVGKEALSASLTVNDSFHIALADAGLGFTAVRIDSLDVAYKSLSKLLDYNGRSQEDFRSVANAGLGDYYYKRNMFDSTRNVLTRLNHLINGGASDGTTAYAVHVLGRLHRDTGQLDSAVIRLQTSLEMWRKLKSNADVIDNLNDLAKTYRLQKDFFNARKYYTAAGTIADKLEYSHKNLYTADLNLLFLKNLKSESYLLAGEEGIKWAEQYAGK